MNPLCLLVLVDVAAIRLALDYLRNLLRCKAKRYYRAERGPALRSATSYKNVSDRTSVRTGEGAE
jgi:hypothetical protein